MREKGGRNAEGKENEEKKTHRKAQRKHNKNIQRKAGSGFEGKKMEPAVCNLCLIQRFKMWNLFLMPLLEGGNATGHEVHTALCKYTCK